VYIHYEAMLEEVPQINRSPTSFSEKAKLKKWSAAGHNVSNPSFLL